MLALIAAASGQASAFWPDSTIAVPNHQIAGDFGLAVAGNGTSLAAWVGPRNLFATVGADSVVAGHRLLRHGRFEINLKLAIDDKGDGLVVWDRTGATGGVEAVFVHHRRFGRVTRVSSGRVGTLDSAAGWSVLTVETPRGRGFRAYYVRPGGRHLIPVPGERPGQYVENAAVNRHGQLTLAWIGVVGFQDRVETASVRLPTGKRTAVRILARGREVAIPPDEEHSTVEYAAALGGPRVAVGSNGSTIIAWTKYAAAKGDVDAHAPGLPIYSVYRDPGQPLSKPRHLTSNADDDLAGLRIGAHGQAVALWREGSNSLRDEAVLLSKTRKIGQPLNRRQFLGRMDTQEPPALAMNAAGDAVVAWQDPDERMTKANFKSHDSSRFGAAEPLRPSNNRYGSSQATPGVGIDDLGRATVLYLRSLAICPPGRLCHDIDELRQSFRTQ